MALAFCWAVLGAPTGKRLAPMMGELVPTLRRFDELQVTDEVATALVSMSPATMDRRLESRRPDHRALVGNPIHDHPSQHWHGEWKHVQAQPPDLPLRADLNVQGVCPMWASHPAISPKTRTSVSSGA